ncbi:MAG: 30S ribosomal protein S12 methylthiotransferase RimO, partial [Clostridia bacterium]|nr:30S ribosomal protein S12 methylthiotransferase RimO [Clostridia bacterium]
MKTKVGVISLGCDKNRIDTEVMLANLAKGGYQITNDQNDADVLIVNTCAFLQSSREEAIDTILEMA